MLTAEQYIVDHWKKNKVWRNLTTEKHLHRLDKCADYLKGFTGLCADVGCACGHSTRAMGIRLDYPFRLVGIDQSETAIRTAKELFPDNIFFYCESATDMEKRFAGVFDAVVCSEVIEHVKDEKALLLALETIANKRIVLTTPAVDAGDPGHVRLYTEADLVKLCEGLAFTIERDGRFWYVVIEKED